MHLRGLSILLSLGAALTAGAAVVYKWTDADGVVHFSDQAVPGAEKVVTSGSASNGIGASARAASTNTSPRPATAVPAAAPRATLSIQSPAGNQSFFGDELVPVRLVVQPDMTSGQTLSWQLNGKPLDDQQNQTAFTLSPLARGTYSLTATVSDSTDTTTQTSTSVTFFVRQPSELAPLNPNRR
jgi:membrane carboxypeptidase/penicillin-binding protein PbpC